MKRGGERAAGTPQTWNISTEFIRLDAFLKLTGAVPTGGQAKACIQQGLVLVNGETCLQRGRKLRPGDRVRLAEEAQAAGGPEEYRVGPALQDGE